MYPFVPTVHLVSELVIKSFPLDFLFLQLPCVSQKLLHCINIPLTMYHVLALKLIEFSLTFLEKWPFLILQSKFET